MSLTKVSYSMITGAPINVKDFGAVGDGVADDYQALQDALNYAYNNGGGNVYVPAGTYKIKYPLFIQSNTWMFGDGTGSKISFYRPFFSLGRAGIVFGQSRIWNRVKAFSQVAVGNYNGPIDDNTFPTLALGTYLENNQSYVQAQNCGISDLWISCDWPNPGYVPTSYEFGGYGVTLCNTQFCNVERLKFTGWNTAINCGNDSSGDYPSNYKVTIKDIDVYQPDAYQVYYAIVFFANSTYCSIDRGTLWDPIQGLGETTNSTASVNVCQDIFINNITVYNQGRVGNSESCFINAKRVRLTNIKINNCKIAISFFGSPSDPNLPQNENEGNVVDGLILTNSDYGVWCANKYSTVRNINAKNSIAAFAFNNTNGIQNHIDSKTVYGDIINLGYSGFTSLYQALSLNYVYGDLEARIAGAIATIASSNVDLSSNGYAVTNTTATVYQFIPLDTFDAIAIGNVVIAGLFTTTTANTDVRLSIVKPKNVDTFNANWDNYESAGYSDVQLNIFSGAPGNFLIQFSPAWYELESITNGYSAYLLIEFTNVPSGTRFYYTRSGGLRKS